MSFKDEVQQEPNRRGFLRVASKFGWTVALAAVSRRALGLEVGMTGTATEERQRREGAVHSMILATEYAVADEVSIPVVQSAFKRYVEETSKGEVHVELHPGGELGLGASLVEKLLTGSIHAAQFSLANLAAYVPAVDVVNIPYWCGDNQRYANLVTSTAWADVIAPKLAAHNLKVLFYYTEDPRTVAVRRHAAGIVRTPGDMKGLKMRVPNSPILTQFYRLVGAEPVVIPWGQSLAALREGSADALDPAVATLYTVGFRDVLGSISLISSVADAQVYACNLSWFNSLSAQARRAIEEASERAMAESFVQLPKCRAYSMEQLTKIGVELYKPTAAEMAAWVDAAGEQRPEWNRFKIELAGSLDTFERLKLAAATKGSYTVDDF